MRKFLLLAMLWISGATVFAQNNNIPLGQWRVHLPYRIAIDLEEAENLIYVATTSSIWSYNKSTGAQDIYSKASGLSGIGITNIGYSSSAEALIIAYDDANIDLVKPDAIVNMPQIKSASIPGSKKVNKIAVVGDTAILVCDFGILILDVKQEVIKASVQFSGSPSFAGKICLDAEIYNGRYYFATSDGIFSVSLSSNILSLDNWDSLTVLPPGAYTELAVFDGKLVAAYSDFYASGGLITGQDSIFTLDASLNKGYINPSYTDPLMGMTSNHGNLVLTFAEKAFAYLPGNNTPVISAGPDLILDGTNGIFASDGNIYLSDAKTGLARAGNANEKLFYPDGPNTDKAYDLDIDQNGGIWLATGGRDFDWKNNFYKDGIYYNINNDWKVQSIPDFGFTEQHQDIIRVLIDPNDPSHVFVASWGTGLYEIRNNTVEAQILNPPFSISPVGFPYRIGGMIYDDKGNLWVSNANSNAPLKKRAPNGTWSDVSFGSFAPSSNATGDLIMDDFGYIWLAVIGKGVLVYNPANNERRLLNNTFNSGDLPDLFIRTLKKDNDGDIWIGTSNGIRVGSPSQVFSGAYNFQKIVLVADDGNNELLLGETVINDIEVDGANRKWIATFNQGVRLVSEDGRTIIRSFTAENSPLLSNTVWGIEIDPTNGEVYFATDRGLCSYKSDATFATNSFGNVLVYPNPVKPDYDGPVAISGMAEDADIKITDIQGNLVYQTKALGGQAIWNGRRYDGKRVQTGVYLVFCANKDASETMITKILFIN